MSPESARARLDDLLSVKPGWDGSGSISPSADLAATVLACGDELRLHGVHFGLTACRDGTFLLTAIGSDGRDADIWVEEPGAVVVVRGDRTREAWDAEDLKVSDVAVVAQWLGVSTVKK